nr:MAG TPA: hypothetical protein [Caudoviricetes sp.]
MLTPAQQHFNRVMAERRHANQRRPANCWPLWGHHVDTCSTTF